jgi:putative tricarboxylic transport membrane protein
MVERAPKIERWCKYFVNIIGSEILMHRIHHTLLKSGLIGVASVSLLALAASGASAEWKPTKQLEIVTHVKTSSSTYRFGKAVATALENLLPKGAKVISIRGARGDRARRHIRVKNANNAHMMQVITPSQVNNPILAKQETRPWMFSTVAMMVVTPNLMTVNANSSYKTMKDIMTKACANPGKVLQGGGDFGNVASLNAILLQRKYNCKITYTPFESQGITELLGGHVDYVMENPGQLLNFVRAGKFRIVAASENLAEFPNVPNYEQAGYGFPVLKQYRGLWMGKEVDPEAVKFWISMVDKIQAEPSYRKYIKNNNLTELQLEGGDVAAMLKQDHENYLKLGTELNLIGKKKKKKK